MRRPLTLGHFLRDRRGVSAVEFALIAPLMLIFYLGAVQLSLALSADRKVTTAASAIADLVAQDDVITNAEMADIMSAGAAIIAPLNPALLQIRISSVVTALDETITIEWSDATGMTPLSEGSGFVLPDGLSAPGRGVVMVELVYPYSTPFQAFGLKNYEIRESFFLRPRQSLTVSRE